MGFRDELARNRFKLRVFLVVYLLLALWAGRTAGTVFLEASYGYRFGPRPDGPSPRFDYVTMMTFGVVLLAWVELRRMRRRGDAVVLSLVDARPLRDRRAANATAEIALAAGLPPPRLWIVEDDAPNAFASGCDPERSCVAVTRGLLDRLDRDEVQAVVAHEIAHIRNGDTMLMTTLLGLGRAFHLLSALAIGPLRWYLQAARNRKAPDAARPARDMSPKTFLLFVLALPLIVALVLGGSLLVTIAAGAVFTALIVALPWLIAGYAAFDLVFGSWLDRRRARKPRTGPWWRFLYLAPVGLITGPAILLLGVLVPVAHLMLRLAVSRNREFQADATAVELTRNPRALASALRKLQDAPRGGLKASLSPLTIVPIRGALGSLFSTHPPLRERIARLDAMSGIERPTVIRDYEPTFDR